MSGCYRKKETELIWKVMAGESYKREDIDIRILAMTTYKGQPICFYRKNFTRSDSLKWVYERIHFEGYVYTDSLAESVYGYSVNHLILHNNFDGGVSVISFDSMYCTQNSILAFTFFRDQLWREQYDYCKDVKQFVLQP